MSDANQLVKMANDIGHFFDAQPSHEEAVTAMAQHIKSYWTRRMLEKLFTHVARDDSGLDELPREVFHRLRSPDSVPTPPPGGDAG